MMAEEKDPTPEELQALKEASEKLFSTLNKEEMTENEKYNVRDIINKYPRILGWKDFDEKIELPDLMSQYKAGQPIDKILEESANSMSVTKQVLNNLQKIKDTVGLPEVENPAGYAIDEGKSSNGETIGTQMAKNVTFLQSLSNDEKFSSEEREKAKRYAVSGYDFLKDMYSKDGIYQANPQRRNLSGQKVADIVKDVVEDRKSLQIEQKSEQAPKKTLTVEELKDKAYQGTLTVEQAEQLRKHEDNKKVADMKSLPGDAKKTRHHSDDKFKDEDVIKYMYENWFLGGMSATFNWVEDTILNTIDSAIELAAQRRAGRKENNKENNKNKTGGEIGKINEFREIANGAIQSLGARCQAKQQSYDAIFNELRNNLGKPNANWQYFDKDDAFIKQLEANSAKAVEFINAASQELHNRTEIIESTGKLATLIASTHMIDEFMRDDKSWKDSKGEYVSKDVLAQRLGEDTHKVQGNLFKAIAVISEDTRLLSEEEYGRIENPQVDLATFTQQNISKEINAFLKQVTDESKEASKQQQQIIDKEQQGEKSKSREVSKHLNGAHRLIQQKINNGAIYNNQIFAEEHSKERIEAKVGLYEEAQQINSPQSLGKVFERIKELNSYQQGTIEERRRDVAARKVRVGQFKGALEQRDAGKKFHLFGSSGRGLG